MMNFQSFSTSGPGPASPQPGTPRQAYPCADDRYPASIGRALAADVPASFRSVHQQLLDPRTERNVATNRALSLLRDALNAVAATDDDLPATPHELTAWMDASARKAMDAYQAYLSERKQGAPRRFFTNRTHALYFLETVAPTKLVDGAWLYGLVRHPRDPRLAGLAQTYLEELGNGDATKNHVVLYRDLLRSQGLGEGAHLSDEHFEQGALQLALGFATEQMLPEVIGFNLGYEQLPLHLLITAYELNELGIDPYYFTLHVTVDNADSGHAHKAIDAVGLNASRYADQQAYWKRVRQGYRLNDLGVGTNAVIASFDLDAEVMRIFTAKSAAGAGAHSDYCRIEGRTVNEWLRDPSQVRGFLGALERKGWLARGTDPAQSRFWQLLRGERAEMFGVFSDYELQAIFDWLRGAASADGARFDAPRAASGAVCRPRSFRAEQRLRERSGASPSCASAGGHRAGEFAHERAGDLLAPGAHWTLEGLGATRDLVDRIRM
jgi:hypothetical protein